jgi:hypothetical protein
MLGQWREREIEGGNLLSGREKKTELLDPWTIPRVSRKPQHRSL